LKTTSPSYPPAIFGRRAPRKAASIALLVGALALLAWPLQGEAQSDSGGWSTPVNLSESGIATNPHLILLSEEDALVAWDESSGPGGSAELSNGVARRRQGEWLPATRAPLAWAGENVQFITGENGQVHAFWIDGDGDLLYRAAGAGEFSSPGVWTSALRMGSGVFAFDATMDEAQRLHLAFLTAEGTPPMLPGVYYLRSGANGLGWSSAHLMYASEYYRQFESGDAVLMFGDELATLPAVAVEAGNEDVPSVYLAWDNPSLKRLFLATSPDGGVSWGDPLEVQGPDSDDPYATPRQPLIQALDRQVLLLWRVYQSGGSCEQLFRLSSDEGLSWGTDGLVLGEQGRCPDTLQPFQISPNRLLMFLTLQSQAFTMGWNGRQWTTPQAQPELDSFEDEDTLTFVELDCRQADLKDGLLAVVGCDRGPGGDIWEIEQPVDLSTVFGPQPAMWTIRPPLPIEAAEVISLAAVGDESAEAQVVWSAPAEGVSSSLSSEVFYVGVDADTTVGPIRVLRAQPGRIDQLELTVDAASRLLAAWSGGELGQVFYSGTSVDEAASSAGWLVPAPISASPGQSPQLALTFGGDSQLVFAVPVNEGRGVFTTRLAADAFNWAPIRPVNSVANSNCPVVADPDVVVAGEDHVYTVWSCWTSPGGAGPLEAYFSASEDGGMTWSPAAVVISDRPSWTELVLAGGDQLHLIWGEARPGGETTWHAWSSDGGLHWTEPESVRVFDGTVGASRVVADAAGRLHLVQAVEAETREPELLYSTWDAGRWRERPGMPFWGNQIGDLAALSLALRGRTQLMAVYAALGPRGAEGERAMGIVIAEFPLGPMPAQPPVPSTIRQTEIAAGSATPPPADAATPTPPAGEKAVSSGQPVVGPAIGLLAAGVLIGGGIWLVRRRRARRPTHSG
jgi:hypothetical protein